MFENIFVALSNFPCIFPICLTFINKDYLTCGLISFVVSASFSSHLVENHKHGMPGIGFSKQVSYVLNRVDVFGCLLIGSRFAQLYYLKYGLSIDIIMKNKYVFLTYCLPFILGRISEFDKYNSKLKNIYIMTHSLWHISIFMTMNAFLLNFIY